MRHNKTGIVRLPYGADPGVRNEVTPKVRARKAAYVAARYVPIPRKIAVCINSCGHTDRPHYAFGLCVACYRISPQGRAVRRRYETSLKGKKTRALPAATRESRADQRAYAATTDILKLATCAGLPAARAPRTVESIAKLEQPLVGIPNITRRAYADRATQPAMFRDFDVLAQSTLGEIKDAKTVSNTRQLRIQKEAAQQSGREHQLITGDKTHVTGNAAQGTQLIRREDLGPK